MNFVRLAIRNIAYYKRKTMIAGALIIISLTTMIVGNSIIDKAISTLKASFTRTLSGDIVIRSISDENITLFGSVEDSILSFLGYKSIFGSTEIPILREYNKIKNYLSSSDHVDCDTPILSGNARISDTIEDSPRLFSTFFGIDPDSYYKMFGDQILLIEGDRLNSKKEGLFISLTNKKTLLNNFRFNLRAKAIIRLLSSGIDSIKIRELPVHGIFEFKNSKIGTFNQINMVNAELLRDTLGIGAAVISDNELASEDLGLLNNSFDDAAIADMIDIDNIVEEDNSALTLMKELEKTLMDKDYSGSRGADYWHFILVRLKNPGQAGNVISSMNKHFNDEGILAEAISWKEAAGSYFFIFSITRIILNSFITILFIVIVFILMNTLVISIIERTAELGTMRALGAKRHFIIKMFLSETLLISLIFGSSGLVFSFLASGILNALKISAANDFFQLIFGGAVLSVSPGFVNIISSFIIIVIVSLIATLIYPIGVALRIHPLQALKAE